jgi:hypothetical protein
MLFHKPVSGVENLNTLVFFLIVIIAQDIVNAPTFGGKFLYQILVKVLLPTNLFTIFTNGAGLVVVTGGANVSILINSHLIMNPKNQNVIGFPRLGVGIVVPGKEGDNVNKVVPLSTFPKLADVLIFENVFKLPRVIPFFI